MQKKTPAREGLEKTEAKEDEGYVKVIGKAGVRIRLRNTDRLQAPIKEGG